MFTGSIEVSLIWKVMGDRYINGKSRHMQIKSIRCHQEGGHKPLDILGNIQNILGRE